MFSIFDNEKKRIAALTEGLVSPSVEIMTSASDLEVSRASKARIIFISLFLLTVIVTQAISSSFIDLIAGVTVIGTAALIRKLQMFSAHWRKIEDFERDYPAFLLSLSSAVKTGLDPLEAIFLGEEIFPRSSVMNQQSHKVKTAINEGKREHEAIRKFGDDISHPDVKLFHDTFIVARECGASIAPALARLAKFTRQRQSFRRRARGAVAMQRLSSYGIIACCLVIGLIQTIANPHSVKVALHNEYGLILLGVGFTLMALGMGWMMYLTRRQL